MPNHSNIFLPQQRRARVGIIVAVLVLLQACSYGYEPEEPWGRESGRKIPDDQGIPIGQLVGRRDAPSEQKTARNIPGVDDPDYQEYL
ncbi:MAG: hypothetical protein OEQ39_29020, partial [Gammaproteobacteria bacterium]|nr:hypothetical protein [Gammaproteobacteria bacterium]